jgi:hypothetical protein
MSCGIYRIKNADNDKFYVGSSVYKKSKIPESERETIKTLYLLEKMNKQQLSSKYGVTPTSMGRYIKRMGI